MFTVLSLAIHEHSMLLHLFVFFDMRKVFFKISLCVPVGTSGRTLLKCPVLLSGKQLGNPETLVFLLILTLFESFHDYWCAILRAF